MATGSTDGLPVTVQPPQPAATQMAPAEMISPEQHVMGVAKTYHTFRRAELAYKLVNETIAGKRKFPLLQIPLPKAPDSDPEAEREYLEIDLHAPFKKEKDPAVQQAKLEKVFGDLNNHFAAEYTGSLRQVALSTLNAWKLLSGENELNAVMGTTFDELVGSLHKTYAGYEPHWLTLKRVEDELALGTVKATLGGVVGLDLSTILAAANVPVEQQAQVLSQVVGGKVAELRKELIPWLATMAGAAATAVGMIDRSNEDRATQAQQVQ